MPNLEYNFGDQKSTIFIAKIIKFHPDLWVFSMKKIRARLPCPFPEKGKIFFSKFYIYRGGIYIYIYVYTLHCTALYIYIYTVYYTLVIYVLKKKNLMLYFLFHYNKIIIYALLCHFCHTLNC